LISAILSYLLVPSSHNTSEKLPSDIGLPKPPNLEVCDSNTMSICI